MQQWWKTAYGKQVGRILLSPLCTVHIIWNLFLISSLLPFKITPPTFFIQHNRSASNYLQKDCNTRNILLQYNYTIQKELSFTFLKRFAEKCLYTQRWYVKKKSMPWKVTLIFLIEFSFSLNVLQNRFSQKDWSSCHFRLLRFFFLCFHFLLLSWGSSSGGGRTPC